MDSKIEKFGLHEIDWPVDRENSKREREWDYCPTYSLFNNTDYRNNLILNNNEQNAINRSARIAELNT